MTTYVIDYSDPLKPGFTIQPGGFNGPGGIVSSTSLRLYGQGALEWGESVDEDIIRLLENFAGATPPINPTPGQLWYQQKLYWCNTLVTFADPVAGTAIVPAGAFYLYDLGTSTWVPCTGTTAPFTITVFNSLHSSISTGINIGDYRWDYNTNVLYRWDSAYRQALVAWLPRAITISASVPGSTIPEQSLQIQNLSGTFASPSVVNATNAANIAITDVTTAATFYPVFVSAITGNLAPNIDSTGLTYNPSTDTLTTVVVSTNTLVSTVATGTAPFTVTSTTPVANLSIGGNAATATFATSATNALVATHITIVDDTTTAATMYPTWVNAAVGDPRPQTTSTKLTFNPNTGALSSTSFAGAGTGLTGTAASLTAAVANGLKSATTTVVVSAATAPTSGQVLTATSGTAAQWATPGGGSITPYIINATPGTAYTVPAYTGTVLVHYSAFAIRAAAATLGWNFYLNGGLLNSWSGGVNYQVAVNPTFDYLFSATGTFTVEITIQSDISHPGQIVIYYF